MKKIICFLTLLLFTVKSFSQTPALSKDYYLKKSKKQKTVAWVMLGGGVAMTAIGSVISDNQIDEDPFGYLYNNEGAGSTILTLAGIGTALGSIPFFLSSAKSKRRALSVAISNRIIFVPQQKGCALNTQPALSLKVVL